MSLGPRGRPARRDANDADLQKIARTMGLTIFTTLPTDWLVYYRGRLALVEIKDGTKRPSARKLTQIEADALRIVGDSGFVIESVADLIRFASQHKP